MNYRLVAGQEDPNTMPVMLQTTLLLICSNVFMTFAVLNMKPPLKLNHVWAALCICAAVCFVFRES